MMNRLIANHPKYFAALLWVGGFLSIASLSLGFYNALGLSIDFQWSPARLLWRGVSPYEYFLESDRSEIILSQSPNYGHLLYFMLWPYAMMSWPVAKLAWATTNVLFLVAGLGMLWKRLERPTDRHLFVIAVILLCVGFSARNVITNGQQTLLIFLAIVTFVTYRDRPIIAGIALAVIVTKYSFGFQIILLALILRQYKAVAVCILISLSAILGVWAMTGDEGLSLIFGPVLVARAGTAIGFGDIMSLGRRLSGGDPLANQSMLVFSMGVNAVYFLTLTYLFRSKSPINFRCYALLVAGTVYLSLATIYHLKYDLMIIFICVYSMILSGVLSFNANLLLIFVSFMLFWWLPRYDIVFEAKPSGIYSVMIMITLLLAFSASCIRLAVIARDR